MKHANSCFSKMKHVKSMFFKHGKREIHFFHMKDEPPTLEPRQLRSVGLKPLLGRLAVAVGIWMAWQPRAMIAPDPAQD